MLKLALIGKNISHSKSQSIYEDLLGEKVDYNLLDYQCSAEIPPLKNLLAIFDGISITSPYKTSFKDEIAHCESPFLAVNTLKLRGDEVIATNTDYLAARDILVGLQKKNKEICILGDGAMSEIVQEICLEESYSFKVLSRRHENLSDYPADSFDQAISHLIINTCAREYRFKVGENKNFKFWDLNYNMLEHANLFNRSSIEYIDGIELLRLQAKYALSFWN